MRKKFDFGTLTVGKTVYHLLRDDDLNEVISIDKDTKKNQLDLEVSKGNPLERVL